MTGPIGDEGARGPDPQPATEGGTARNVGVGCFTSFLGLWSGAMVAVLIGKIVEGIRRSPSCEGLPMCNWYVYAASGALVGALSLPLLVLMRLRRRGAVRKPTSRG